MLAAGPPMAAVIASHSAPVLVSHHSLTGPSARVSRPRDEAVLLAGHRQPAHPRPHRPRQGLNRLDQRLHPVGGVLFAATIGRCRQFQRPCLLRQHRACRRVVGDHFHALRAGVDAQIHAHALHVPAIRTASPPDVHRWTSSLPGASPAWQCAVPQSAAARWPHALAACAESSARRVPVRATAARAFNLF